MAARDYPAPSLVVLVGPPGAGKTTWLQNNLADAVRVDLEEIRRNPDANRGAIIDAAIDKAFTELRAGRIVAFDSTAINADFRARLRGVAAHVNAPAYAVVFDVPLDDLLAAQKTRTSPVPDARVRELYDQFRDQLVDIYAEGWAATDTVTRTQDARTREVRAIVDLTPTSAIAAAARKGLELHEAGKSGDGLVAATVRDARRMAAREALSEQKVRRMPGWFARHATDKTPGWDTPGEETPGYVAWLLWGGDTAQRWAERKVKQLDEAQDERSITPVQSAPDMTKRALAPKLGKLLADVVTLAMHAQGAHWNVKGEDFAQFHSLFGDIYEDVEESIDPLAENILKLGYDAPFRMSEFVAMREVEDPVVAPDTPQTLALLLLAGNEGVLECLREAFDEAVAANEQGVANFLADRIDAHQKWAWQLKTILGLQPQEQLPEDDDEDDDAEDVNDEADDEADDESMVERAYSPVRLQYRSSGAGKQYRVIQGYVARTNSLSEDLGGFREILAPGAFRTALRNQDGSPKDVRLLYSHNVEAVLARTGVNMELEEDELGLRMWARVDMSDPDVARVASKMEQGLIDAASFGFTVAEDSWADGPSYPIRTVRKIDTLFEVTVCAWPAFTATRLSIMDDAIRSGRLPQGGAARTAPDLVGVSSREHISGTGTRSAAAWQARLSLRKTQSKRYLP